MIKTLNNGYSMPQVGLGTFRAEEGNECYNAVLEALYCGYRHIDTANVYQNEESVGKAILESKIDRKEIFVTTKLHPAKLGYENAILECNKSLKLLQLDYIDLYLIHWPSQNYDINYETWKAFELLYQQGKIKAIGVSNFQIHHLADLLSRCTIKPTVNQIELHPGLNQISLQNFCNKNNIDVISYGPFMKGEVFQMDLLKDLANKYQKSIPNIIVRWGIQRNIFMIPKSVSKNRIIENFAVFDFEISNEDMEKINGLNKGRRVYTDPDNNPFTPY